MAQKSALIVGAGPGLSASVARKCAQRGMAVALVARDTAKLAGLASEIGAARFACDVSDPSSVAELFTKLDAATGTADLQLCHSFYEEKVKNKGY